MDHLTFRQEAAETLALQALGWLAANDDLFPAFLGSTGASVSDLPGAAANPEFLGSVLDFMMQDDAWIIAFCDTVGRAYTDVAVARAALPGGAQTNWT